MGDPAVSDRLTGLTYREANWAGLRVLVTGMGLSGFAAADALLELGASVIVVDAGAQGVAQDEKAHLLEVLGAEVRRGPEHVARWPKDEIDLVVTSPGWRPTQPLLAHAAEHGIAVWAEVELAWRIRPEVGGAPWIAVTGTNGKTTTVKMAESILRAAGLRAIAVGNVGKPVMEAILDTEPYDVLVVELSSFQLHYTASIAPVASCVLNVAPDHLDWHGSLAAYASAKAKIYNNTSLACVYNVADPATEKMVQEADVQEGARAIGFTLGMPGLSMVGVVEEVLADRAFIEERNTSAAELATLSDLDSSGVPAPHLVSNALAAAALTRAIGVPTSAVQQGLRDFEPQEHRITQVAISDNVRFINDSKATNPHAAGASIQAYEHVVWIAGGQLKGAEVDEVVRGAASRLRAVVLMGQDADLIAQALQRHAPQVPVQVISTDDTGNMTSAAQTELVMDQVVSAARASAQPGDAVLLAPAAASLDMFENYKARGAAFTAAVQRALGSTP